MQAAPTKSDGVKGEECDQHSEKIVLHGVHGSMAGAYGVSSSMVGCEVS